MINISQSLQYAKNCRELSISLEPRTEAELLAVLKPLPDSDAKEAMYMLMLSPKTADAYIELLRIQISMRAMGIIPRHHACAMINVQNMQQMLAGFGQPINVHNEAMKYRFGDLHKYGAMLTYAERWYKLLDKADKLDSVFSESKLSRLLSLYEYVEYDSVEAANEVSRPVILPHLRMHG